MNEIIIDPITQRKQQNITGIRFGNLTAIKFIEKRKKHPYWVFRCDCGVEKVFNMWNVILGKSKSCGCLRVKANIKRKIHGLSKNCRLYRIWQAMKSRCLNKNNIAYKNYGERGIKVCKEWLQFEGFLKGMKDSYNNHIKKYGIKNTTIDRVNNNSNYCKKNCRWATWKEQSSNKRKK